MTKETTYKAKQEWLERVMASSLTPATKVFAFGIFKRMYGDKVTSFPSEKVLAEDTGLARSKFSVHRKALIQAGALEANLRTGKAGRPSYEYTLNLNWSPEGTLNVPTGNVQMSPEGTLNVPTGSGNTTSNTTKEDYKVREQAKPVADAPAFPLSSIKEVQGEDEGSLSVVDTASPLVVNVPQEPRNLVMEYAGKIENRQDRDRFFWYVNHKRMNAVEAYNALQEDLADAWF